MKDFPKPPEKTDKEIAKKISAIKKLPAAYSETALKNILSFISGLEVGQNIAASNGVSNK